MLPLVVLTEIGFLVAFGILLDTILVRSILVPALVMEVGDKVWWPSRLSNEARKAPAEEEDAGRRPAPEGGPARRRLAPRNRRGRPLTSAAAPTFERRPAARERGRR